uniref:Metallo-beta-lactamase domain-containing protein n=1 Tax=Ananas comosus var. bracteatus TaxID=296719 RepID=A0A6V7QRR1_ANACO
MPISSTLSSPSLLPSHFLPFDPSHAAPHLTVPSSSSSAAAADRFRALAIKKSGFLSVIDRAMEEEEYRRARAEVRRKGVDVEGYLIEGVSVGGHETCVVVPSLNSAFDIGRCPAKAVHQDFLFITHAHLDHIVRSLSSLFPLLNAVSNGDALGNWEKEGFGAIQYKYSMI